MSKRNFTLAQEVEADRLLNALRANFYVALGVSDTASVAEIKSAYHKLSRKVHPDKNGAPSAEAAFKTMRHAVEALSDVRKREIYDVHGDLPCLDDDLDGTLFPNLAPATTHVLASNAKMLGTNNLLDDYCAAAVPVVAWELAHGASRRGKECANLVVLFVLVAAFVTTVIFTEGSQSSASKKLYALTAQEPFSTLQHTSKDAPYYVSSTKDFEAHFPSSSHSRMMLEEEIDDALLQVWAEQCIEAKFEQQQKQQQQRDQQPPEACTKYTKLFLAY